MAVGGCAGVVLGGERLRNEKGQQQIGGDEFDSAFVHGAEAKPRPGWWRGKNRVGNASSSTELTEDRKCKMQNEGLVVAARNRRTAPTLQQLERFK
jgi:hypothetical protein